MFEGPRTGQRLELVNDRESDERLKYIKLSPNFIGVTKYLLPQTQKQKNRTNPH